MKTRHRDGAPVVYRQCWYNPVQLDCISDALSSYCAAEAVVFRVSFIYVVRFGRGLSFIIKHCNHNLSLYWKKIGSFKTFPCAFELHRQLHPCSKNSFYWIKSFILSLFLSTYSTKLHLVLVFPTLTLSTDSN